MACIVQSGIYPSSYDYRSSVAYYKYCDMRRIERHMASLLSSFRSNIPHCSSEYISYILLHDSFPDSSDCHS